MGVTGVVFNNLTEILAVLFVAWLGYCAGRAVQKRWPTKHLRPWLWGKDRV